MRILNGVISFLYCIAILRNFVISSIFVCVLLCRTQSSTVWNISLSCLLWIFMQIRRHGIIPVAVHLTHLMMIQYHTQTLLWAKVAWKLNLLITVLAKTSCRLQLIHHLLCCTDSLFRVEREF